MSSALDTHVIAYQGESLYDFDNEIMLNWYPQRIIDLSGEAKTVLELGLGHGHSTNIFSNHFERYKVLDGSSAVIENYKKRFPESKAEIVEVFFENFSAEEKFDLIILGFILEHVDNPNQIISHYKQFLAPNGKMFIAVPNAEVLNRRLGHLAGMLPDMQQLSEYDHILGHKRFYTVQTLRTEVENAGLKIEKVEGIYLKPFTTKQMLSLNFDKSVLNALCMVGVDYPELSCGLLMQLAAIK